MANESRSEGEQGVRSCMTCFGSGEFVSEMGPEDCPDCRGVGTLPSRATLTEWRARDIEQRYAASQEEHAPDVRWLLAEFHRTRDTLTQIAALAMDGNERDPIVRQIRGTAYQALGLYDSIALEPPRAEPS